MLVDERATSPRADEELAVGTSSVRAVLFVFRVLDRRTQMRMVGLLALALLAAAMEGLGVGAVIPLVAAITSSEIVGGGRLMTWLRELRVLIPPDGLGMVALVVFAIFAAKNALLALNVRAQTRFVYDGYATVASKLFRDHLHAPWGELSGENSATRIREVVDDTRLLFADVASGALMLATHALATIVVLAVLAAVGAGVALVTLATLASVGAVYLVASRKRSAVLASDRRRARTEMTRLVQDGLAAAKEVRVRAREEWFAQRFSTEAFAFAEAETFYRRAIRMPRLVVETVAVLGVALALLFVDARGGDASASLPLLAAFGVALSRLVPGVQSMVSVVVGIRRGAPTPAFMDRLQAALARGLQTAPPPHPVNDNIRLQQAAVTYPGRSESALGPVDFTWTSGESVALVGRSGAGKTTLADVLLGVSAPTQGEVLHDGSPARGRPARCSYLPQRAHLLDDSVRANVAFARDEDQTRDDDRIWLACERAGVGDVVRALPGGLDGRLGERGALLSGGEAQRIGIARVLFDDPAWLVLDEATSSVDEPTSQAIVDAVFTLEPRPALLVIAHRMSTVRRCERVVLLQGGRVVDEGPFDEVLERCDELKELAAEVLVDD